MSERDCARSRFSGQVPLPCGLAVPACESACAAGLNIARRHISDTQPRLPATAPPGWPMRWPEQSAAAKWIAVARAAAGLQPVGATGTRLPRLSHTPARHVEDRI